MATGRYFHARIGCALVLLIVLMGGGLWHHASLSLNHGWFVDDARQQTWVLMRAGSPDAEVRLRDDFVASYMMSVTIPPAFSTAVTRLAPLVPPAQALTFLGYGCFLAIIGFLSASAWRFAGGWAAFWTAALVLASDAWLVRVAGGLPRSVGAMLCAMAIYGLISRRLPVTAAATLMGALFWYPAAVVGGVFVAIQLLAPPSWSIAVVSPKLPSQRWLLLTGLAVATALPVLPHLLQNHAFGPLVPSDDPNFPEAGEDGRFGRNDLLLGTRPFHRFAKEGAATYLASGSRAGNPWRSQWTTNADAVAKGLAIVCFLLVCAGTVAGMRHPGNTRAGWMRVGLIPVAAGLLFAIAAAGAPYFYAPARYMEILLPMFASIATYPALSVVLGLLHPLRTRAPCFASAFLVAIIALCGGRPWEQGLHPEEAPQRALWERLSSVLPASALVAGWPEGAIEDLPLHMDCRVLVTREVHLPWRADYALEMRRRTNAVIAAEYDPTPESLQHLYEHFHATHYLVDKARSARSYFVPFDQTIERVRQRWQGESAFVYADAGAVVFEDDRWRVIALTQLQSGTD